MESVLILDGQLKSALCAVRSLGHAGVPVVVGAERETGVALHSRYVTGKFVYPSPLKGQHAFVDAAKGEAIRIGGKPIVYAFSDATVLALYAHKTDLCAYVTLVFPEDKSVEIAFDKSATYSLARVSGIPTITTYVPEREEEVLHLAPTLTYPVVMKTRRSVTWRGDGVGVFGTAMFIHSETELIQKFKEVDAKILSLVAESTDPEINKLKPDRYSALLKPPVPGKSDGTSINMKFMVDRCEKKKYDSRTGTWIDGTLLDLNRDSVEALYIGFSFSSIWAIRSDWGLSMWANKFYIMPSTKSTMLTLPKPMPRAAVEDDDMGDNTEDDNGDDDGGGDDGENVDGGRKKVRVS